MTHLYVWHDTPIYVWHLTHMCDNTFVQDLLYLFLWVMLWKFHSQVGHNSFTLWHDSPIRVTWHTYMCDISRICVTILVCRTSYICSYGWCCENRSRGRGTGAMTHSYIWHIIYLDMTHSHIWYITYVWHDASIDVRPRCRCHDSFICMCDTTHLSTWHDSYVRVTWHVSHIWKRDAVEKTMVSRLKHRCYRAFLYVCDMTHPSTWHDSFVCVIWRRSPMWRRDTVRNPPPVTWLVRVSPMCNVTYFAVCVVWRNHVPWLVRMPSMCDVTRVTYVEERHWGKEGRSRGWGTGAMTDPYVCETIRYYMWHDSLIHVTWLTNVWHDACHL